ncbi:Hypothetical protein, putative [Bodo saltans]|uniref:SET domain-containing protein n=1 Tax=Bodo saltans TaxID=75058 RepID=A0A0S4IJK9_BODSA|nr:Hypothetical protein, putative [Bodo saltans]|eukprot:CUE89232.1 Hypothetical protein, putative [Bodo saltans]
MTSHHQTMESSRLAANEHFKNGRLQEAAVLYTSALEVVFTNFPRTKLGKSTTTTLPQDLLDEFTKSAGNVATCLHKLKKFGDCAAVCHRALQVNPFLAKCHAFLGMSLMDEAALSSSSSSSRGVVVAREEAHMHLCRAMFLLPAMTAQLTPYITMLVDTLSKDYETCANRDASVSPAVVTSSSVASVREAAQGCGHGVFVDAATIDAATPIASLLHPFSVVSYSETDGLGVCVACATPNTVGNDDGLHCPQCKRVWFCSDSCRASYSIQHAEHECAVFVKLTEMVKQIEVRQLDVPNDFEDIATHCIVTRSAMKVKKSGYERIQKLENHMVEVSQTLAPIGSLMKDLFPNESEEFIAQLVGAVRCNALEVCDATGLGIGQALHTTGLASFFNHSCAPNCAIDHRSQSILTTRTVRKDEELSIAYIPQLYWPMNLRREGLADRFFFTCRCRRCSAAESGEDVMESVLCGTLPNARPNATDYYHAVIETLCSGVRSRHVSDIDKGVLKELLDTRTEAEKHLMPCHYTLQDLRNTLTFVYSVMGMAPDSRRSCSEELLLWESLIPGRLPVKLDKLRNAAMCRDIEEQNNSTAAAVSSGSEEVAVRVSDAAVEALSALLPRYSSMYGL